MPQGKLDEILARLRSRGAAITGDGTASNPEVLPAEDNDPNSPAGSGNPDVDAILAKIQARRNAPEAQADEVPAWRRWLATGARVGGSWLGGIVAGAAATPETLGAGTIPAAIAGGAAGGAGGEALAEWIEGRKKLNPLQIGVQGAIGAVPLGSIMKGPLAPLLLKGATVGAVSSGLSESAETGKLPSARSLEQGALIGGATGGVFRGLEHLIPALGKLRLGKSSEPQMSAVPTDAELGVEAAIPNRGSRQPMPEYRPTQPTPRRAAADIAFENSRRMGTPRELPPPPEDTTEAITDQIGGQRTYPGMPSRQQPLDIAPQGSLPFNESPTSALPPSVRRLIEPVVDEDVAPAITNNASGESSASVEALNRQRSMQAKGEQFVVYNRLGERRPLIGPDAVDYAVNHGETYGIEGPNGFRVLDDAGGRVPPQARLPRAVQGAISPIPRELESVDTVDITPPQERSIPPEIQALHEDLVPKWKAALAKQEGDQIPFTVDPHEDIHDFATRVMSDDPKNLMGAERKVRAALEARGITANDVGAIDPAILYHLVGAGVGALTGAAVDREHPLRGALGGAAVGLGGVTAIKNPALLERLRYFSMLSGPATQAKNILGNAGAVAGRAAELGLTGQGSRAARLIKEVFSGKTTEKARTAFLSPASEHAALGESGKWGSTEGVLGIPGRAMDAMDVATQDALVRGGETPEMARTIAYRSKPKSRFGRAVAEFPSKAGPLGKMLVPFAQTATNLFERGIERTPGLGFLPGVRNMTNATMGEATARQALGALAVLAGAQLHPSETDHTANAKWMRQAAPYLAALSGPFAVPYAVGAAGKKALSKKGKKSTPSDVINAAAQAMLSAAPLPPDAASFQPGKIGASFVPNALSLLSETPPNEFDTTGSVFNPALAKIPMLNQLLLKRKHGPALRRAQGR